jgi:hypothetical protein
MQQQQQRSVAQATPSLTAPNGVACANTMSTVSTRTDTSSQHFISAGQVLRLSYLPAP